MLHQRCVDAFEVSDVSSYLDADTAMRDSIFELAANGKLTELYRVLHAQLRLPIMAGTSLPEWARPLRNRSKSCWLWR